MAVSPPFIHRRRRRRHTGVGQLAVSSLLLLCVTAVLGGLLALTVSAASVEETRLMAVDLGAEWTKTATLDFTVSPDKAPAAAVNILLNDQANRKSPPCVAFRCARKAEAGKTGVVCERSFAEEALSLAPRFPTQVVCGPALLLGHTSSEALERALAETVAKTALLNGSAASLGKPLSLSSSEVADRFLYHVAADPTRDGFQVWIPSGAPHPKDEGSLASGLTYTPEELTAMLLGQLTETVRKHDAERNGLPRHNFLALDGAAPAPGDENKKTAASQGPRVRHAAITVPSFSTVAERQALMDAGEMAGLRVVRLVHSVTAAATALAYYREESLFPAHHGAAAPATYIMIFDMGSRQTEAAVFALTPHTPSIPPNGIKLGATTGAEATRRRGTVGRITLVGMATNRTLGGLSFDQCIAQYWDREFLAGRVFAPLPAEASPETKREAGKQRAAMLRAANKARERLSANREAPVTVEGVSAAGGAAGPFTTSLSRNTFESVCGELFTSAVAVRDAALARASSHLAASGNAAEPASLTLRQLQRFEAVGGASRMPKLLEMISQGYGGNLVDRTLNGDEAVAVGTAYLGAAAAEMLPRKFLVREALTNDIGAFLVSDAQDKKQGGGTVQAVWENSDDTDANGPIALFPAYKTMLPATRTLVLTNVTDDLSLTLASPPQLAEHALRTAVERGHGAPTASVVCPGCFMQHNRITGLEDATRRASFVESAHTKNNVKVSLTNAEVVLEASVSENGLPYLRKAYLRASYTKEVHPQTEEAGGNATEEATNATGEADATHHSEENHDNHDDDDNENEREARDTAAGPETPSGMPPQDDGNTSSSVKVSSFIRTFALSARVVYADKDKAAALPHGINLSPDRIEASRETLRELQRSDDYRYACSHLRNAMEGHLISLRLLDAYTNEVDITEAMLATAGIVAQEDGNKEEGSSTVAQDLLRWRDVVRELSDWLDDYGESASRAELVERNARVEALKRGVAKVLNK